MKENENRQNMFMLEIGETAFPSELVINDLEGGGGQQEQVVRQGGNGVNKPLNLQT